MSSRYLYLHLRCSKGLWASGVFKELRNDNDMASLRLRGSLGLAVGSNARSRKEFKTWVQKECTNQYDSSKRGVYHVTYVCGVMLGNERTTRMKAIEFGTV